MVNRDDNVRDLIDLAVAQQEPNFDLDKPFVVVPKDYRVEDLEKLRDEPARKRGTVHLHDAASFIAYANRHSGAGTAVYGQADPALFVAVLNGHADAPGWGDHRAQYDCPTAKEWQLWTSLSGKMRSQLEFAAFLEMNFVDIVGLDHEPTGADLLQVALQFKAQKKVNFASGQRLDNGQVQFVYQEEVAAGAGPKGHIKVPEAFFLQLPVYEGGPTYRIEAKLRYKIAEGGLTMGYELVRPHKVLELAFGQLWAQIKAAVNAPLLRGIAPPALA